MAHEDQDTRTDKQRIDDLERMLQEQKNLLEQANQREKNLTSQLANMLPTLSTSINNSNNQAKTAEVDVRCLQFQPVINHYASPIKSGDPDKWINWYEEATQEILWSDQKRSNNMVVYLEDQAAKWAINNKLNEWTAIKEAFIKHFRSMQCERSDFDTFKFHPRGNLTKFVELKEEKANAAGIAEEEAVQQTVLNGRMPTIFAFQLSDNLPKTFDELKRRLNRLVTIQQQQPNQENNAYERQNQRQFYRPMAHYQQVQRKVPYPLRPNNRPNNKQSLRPPTPCPICKQKQIISYHWVSECRNRQNNFQQNNRSNNRPTQGVNTKQVQSFEHQDTNQNNNQAPN